MKYLILTFLTSLFFSFSSNATILPPITGTTIICRGTTDTLSDASGGGTWMSNNTAIATIDPTAGALTGVMAGTTTITYTIGAAYVTTVVTINSLPNVYVVGGGGSYCSGGTGLNITLSGSDTGVGYQLYHGVFLVGSPQAGTGSGLTYGPMLGHGAYAIIATNNTTGCADSMLGLATITINPLPNTDTLFVSGSGHYCTGGTGLDVFVRPSTTGVKYKLYDYSTLVDSTTGITGSPADFGIQTSAGVYKVIATNSFGCSSLMANNPSITIDPLPVVYALAGGGGYCAGGAGSDVRLAHSDNGVTYSLYEGGVPTGTNKAGINALLDFGFQTTQGGYTIVAKNNISGCTAQMSGRDTVYALPVPTAISGTAKLCAGSTTLLSDGTSGGTWSSLNTVVATINPTSGVVTGVSAGNATIRYTSASCGFATKAVTVNPLPTVYSLSGGGSYCSGGSGAHVFVGHSDAGVNYALFDTILMSTKTGTGTSIDFGAQTRGGNYTVVGTYSVTGCAQSMSGTVPVYINPLPTLYTVSGGGHYCAGGTGRHIGLSGSSAGTTYDLYVGGVHTGPTLAGGTGALDFGTYTTGGVYQVVGTNIGSGCTDTMSSSAVITIDPLATITGPTEICAGAGALLTPSLPGGTWTSSNTTIVTVDYTGGSTLGISAGTAIISYKLTSGCVTVVTNTVDPLPTITGSSSVCVGSTITLTAPFGGTWSTSHPPIATIATIGGSLGVVTGVSAGVDTLTYKLSTGCLSSVSVTVLSLPTITASAAQAACGDLYTLTSTGGIVYSWSPAAGLACDTCAVTTIRPSATTTYTVTASGVTGCFSSDTVTINGNRISGYITFGGVKPDTLGTKVWLIKYNPTDTVVVVEDSTTSCNVGGIGYYEFDGVPAGDYLVTAKMQHGNNPGGSGYLPTYGTSSPHWDSAATIIHYSGFDTAHIVMAYGTVIAGAGVISGNISSGAGKGTSGNIPANGMLVFLENEFTNVLTYTYTDAAGNYTFTHLADGNYIVYPEEYIYSTTPSEVIVPSSTTSDSTTNINFKKFTTSRIIVPYDIVNGIKEIAGTGWSVKLFPNPNKGNLTIVERPAGLSDVVVTDIMGREVYKQTIDATSANNGAGEVQIDLQGLTNGIYVISVKSENNVYTGRIVIQK